MKKLFIILLLVIGLGACSPSPNQYDDTNIKQDIQDLNDKVSSIETRLDGIDIELQGIAQDIITLHNFVDNHSIYDDTQVIATLDSLLLKLTELETKHDSDVLLLDIELNLLYEELQAINDRLDNITVTTGLNGQKSIYENQVAQYSGIARLIAQVEFMKETFDSIKAPSYIVDANGDYISFKDLGVMLKQKYFGAEYNEQDIYMMGSKAYMQMVFEGENDVDDLFARIVLLVEEIRNYPFYILSSSELVIFIANGNNNIKLTIPLVTMLNDYFEISLEGIHANDYEMILTGSQTNLAVAQSFYDYHVSKGTYDGFVLDWK